ncbi:hypothetical protein [Chryseobacterium wanjuense]
MGWNSWNCFGHEVSADKVKRAADALVKSGLVNHGWNYINIDDSWQYNRDGKDPSFQGKMRDENGYILTNSKFPDMKELTDYFHSKGLKAGIYSSPDLGLAVVAQEATVTKNKMPKAMQNGGLII